MDCPSLRPSSASLSASSVSSLTIADPLAGRTANAAPGGRLASACSLLLYQANYERYNLYVRFDSRRGAATGPDRVTASRTGDRPGPERASQRWCSSAADEHAAGR